LGMGDTGKIRIKVRKKKRNYLAQGYYGRTWRWKKRGGGKGGPEKSKQPLLGNFQKAEKELQNVENLGGN